MKLVTVNNTFEPLINQRLRLQKTYSAANSMMVQLQIPQGDNLLYVMGYPNASDNKGAICRWILDQNNSAVISNESYVILKRRLRRILFEAEFGGLYE